MKSLIILDQQNIKNRSRYSESSTNLDLEYQITLDDFEEKFQIKRLAREEKRSFVLQVLPIITTTIIHKIALWVVFKVFKRHIEGEINSN